MERFLQYVSHHPLLVAAAAVLALVAAVFEFRNRAQSGATVGTTDAVRFINDGAAVLDVRPAEQYAEGHIIDARNVPHADLQNSVGSLGKYRDKPLIVCCGNGTASANATRWLKTQGFSKVAQLRGGLDAWRQDNLPLVKATAAVPAKLKEAKRS